MRKLLTADLEHILVYTSAVWDELEGARIFVTGGTGFFGCWLLESFAWACDEHGLGATITVLTRSPEAFRRKAPHLAGHHAIRLIRGDVRSFDFPQNHYTHLIHAATEASARLNREQPELMLETIVEGTRQTLDFAATAGVKRFLNISSGAIYGIQPPSLKRMPEEYAGRVTAHPITVYGKGKQTTEALGDFYAHTHALEILTARCFTFVGPHLPLNTHFAIGNFIDDCLHQRSIEIRGDGTPYRSYLYAADLAIWLWTILARGIPGRAYNVGSDQPVNIAELAETTREALDCDRPVKIAGIPDSDGAAERYVPDTTRAREELGLRQRIPLQEAIRRTAAWHTAGAPVQAAAMPLYEARV